MHVTFFHCGVEQTLSLANARGRRGALRCGECREPITTVDVAGCRTWLEQQVEHKRRLAAAGRLGTRKQSRRQSDAEIDLDGLAAELAACVLLCPGAFDRWRRATELGGNNRGRDLLPRWTKFDKPVEVKQTRYHDDRRGFLLIRPPRGTPGAMRLEYIDDAYYILLHGEPCSYEICGWIDRVGLLQNGQRNPVPVSPGQRECWGMHWSQLRPIGELLSRCPASHESATLGTSLLHAAAEMWHRLRRWF